MHRCGRRSTRAQTAALSSSSTNPAHYSAASATPTSPKSVVIWTHWSPLCSTPWAPSCPPSCSRRADGKETDRHGNNQKKRWSICRSCRGVLLRKWLHHRKQCPLDRKELRHETH